VVAMKVALAPFAEVGPDPAEGVGLVHEAGGQNARHRPVLPRKWQVAITRVKPRACKPRRPRPQLKRCKNVHPGESRDPFFGRTSSGKMGPGFRRDRRT